MASKGRSGRESDRSCGIARERDLNGPALSVTFVGTGVGNVPSALTLWPWIWIPAVAVIPPGDLIVSILADVKLLGSCGPAGQLLTGVTT